MGKDQELLQAVKTEDLLTVQKLLQRPKPGKARLREGQKSKKDKKEWMPGHSPVVRGCRFDSSLASFSSTGLHWRGL
ncbi:caskin-1 isoform X6 [Arapaima gigas]